MRRSTLRWLVPLGALVCLSGCGTVNSFAGGCPGRYSGVRQDLDLIGQYRSKETLYPEVQVGFDGTLGNVWDTVFVASDLPLAAIADTLALPFTASRDEPPARPLALGCGWATAAIGGG